MATAETGRLVSKERLVLAVKAFREEPERGLTRVQLAKAMGHVGIRSADRAREVLDEQGAKFEMSSDPRTREKVFIMTKGPKWDESISQETQLALRLAALTLGQGGNSILEKQLGTLEKITEKSLTDRDRKIYERLRKNIRVKGGVAENPTSGQMAALEAVFKAFSAEIPRQLEVTYRRARAKSSSTMTFAPYCLTQDLISGGTYVMGVDVEKREIRQLRLSRIEHAKVLNRPVIFLREQERELERAAEYQVGGWYDGSAPFDVVIRIEGDHWIQAMEEARPDFPGFEVVEKKADHIIITFRANQPIGLIRWILQFGPCAEVLEPASMREAVREDVEAMAKTYRRRV